MPPSPAIPPPESFPPSDVLHSTLLVLGPRRFFLRHHLSLRPASGAQRQGADLRGSDLRDTDLAGANLEGAFLEGSTLRAPPFPPHAS